MVDYNKSEKNFEILFFKVYRNKYLNHKIYTHLSLFREYRKIELNLDPIEILKYREYFSYIQEIKYNGTLELPLSRFSFPILKTIEIGRFSKTPPENISYLTSIDPASVPNSVDTIIFPLDEDINVTCLRNFPDSIKTFKNVKFLNQNDYYIPSGVTSLTFNSTIGFWNIKDFFPPTLTFLDLGLAWAYTSVIGILPQSMKTLKVRTQIYDESIFPSSLTDLTMSQVPKLIGLYPKNLKKLSIISTVHSDLNLNSLNGLNSLEILELDTNSLLLEINSVPQSVTILNIKTASFHNLYRDMLPKSLKSLKINVYVDSFRIISLPVGLLELNCISSGLKDLDVGLLPESLTSLCLGKKKNKGFNKPIKDGYLPNYLKSLDFGEFNQQINYLPHSLVNLNFGEFFNKQIIPNSLPSNVEKIVFSPLFNQKLLLNSLPLKLVHLEFGNNFNNQIPVDILPQSLKTLIFGNRFNQLFLPGSLPSSISKLIIGNKGSITASCFNNPINENVLPQTLKHFELNCPRYSHPINESFLPSSLRIFIVSDNIIKNDRVF
ncbi:hypothetical protein DICPUDRAFT_148944 [Dictyostelium purpureum]|uniref:FNIP repeat-containing protein n=1 Tax=Dictyostelium purpureum TaxID=5786 RepID=F0ZCE4_DICPU|nr:uncharacterized protein DICPUDRAFT_148944 [Dictyostelium purpureum]EGC38407.1 hypothetical protein DICPUDRAFT_148944 [Dictyostelium purpureum]|eukprot:XP_003285068.1 hypothetical protein DICPUDRAFT_148944 [Dictyostelium purpureum]